MHDRFKVFGWRVYPGGLGGFLALLVACSSPGYNDNPSQQVSNPRLGCPVATEFFSVNFNVHVQPPADLQDARVANDMFRAYCHNIPVPGRVFLTVDLIGPELARTALGVRVVEQNSVSGEVGEAAEFSAPSILDLPKQRYAKGMIEASFDLTRNGDYAIYVTRDGSQAEGDQLVIPLHVGDAAAMAGMLQELVFPLVLMLFLCLLIYGALRHWRGRNES